MRFAKPVICIVLIICVVFTASAAHAQMESELDIRIGSVSTQETQDSMLLKVYFNIYDPKTSLPVLDNITKSVEIALPQFNYVVSPQIKKPDVPIYVVLVLDASGSMGGSAESLKKAANLALDNVPDNSYFSVVQFDETITQLQDFTQNIYSVRDAINRQYTVSQKGTCLYDASYSAIEALQKTTTAGRRAIILFTDGKDENQAGKPCSKHTYKEMTDLAAKYQVPINSVGLSYKEGNLNELELKTMADVTGGFSAIAKNADAMIQAFENIMDVLKSQWMVEANIYPRRGPNKATLTVNLKDNDQPLIKPIDGINSTVDYFVPSPVTAQNPKLELNAKTLDYDFYLSLNHPELVEHLQVSVHDTKANSTVKDYPFSSQELTTDNKFTISTKSLIANHEYTLIVTAISKDDKQLLIGIDQNGRAAKEFLYPFTYDPSTAYPSLVIQSLEEDNNKHDVILDLSTTHPDLIYGFEAWLEDENTGGTKVSDSLFTLAATDLVNNSLRIPLHMRNIPDGAKYIVVVRALAQNGKAYPGVEDARKEMAYTAPTIFERLATGLINYWYISLIILAVIGFAVWFVVKNVKREKGSSSTPVLQGLLGSNKTSGGPIVAIANDEPILSRGRVSQQAPPSRVHQVQHTEESTAAAPTIIEDAPLTQAANEKGHQTAQITVLQTQGSMPQGPTPIHHPLFTIGRAEANLTIKDTNLSRRHAQITYDNIQQNYWLTDLGSSNGTYLNGQRLVANHPVALSNGAIIKLGTNTTARFDLY